MLRTTISAVLCALLSSPMPAFGEAQLYDVRGHLWRANPTGRAVYMGKVSCGKPLGAYLEENAREVKVFEGQTVLHGRHVAHRGPRGELLIGYGHHLTNSRLGRSMATAIASTGLTEIEAEELLVADLAHLHAELLDHVPAYGDLFDSGDVGRAGAVLHLTYTLGLAGVLTFKKLLAAVEDGRYQDAVRSIRQSTWHGQVARERSAFVMAALETGRTAR